jgi:FdhD protein
MKASKTWEILKFRGAEPTSKGDLLVVEEPLEIRLGFEREGVRHQKSISVTMRTPGHDDELALGFLFTEGILHDFAQVKKIHRPAVRRKQARGNIITLDMVRDFAFDFKTLERHFYTTSSCGVCGKASIEAVEVKCSFDLPEGEPKISVGLLHALPQKLIEHQSIFDCTGGLHAAALFNADGKLLTAREDIGRHNALDKLIGFHFRKNDLPLFDKLVLVSGRAGFELVQKSVVAGVPILAAVGAPSSLAVQLAEDSGLTLVGFLRNGQFNVYTHPERIVH